MVAQDTGVMAQAARDCLISIGQRHGYDVYNDARRCEALLRDGCGDNRREIGVLIGALKQGVIARLLDGSRSTAPLSVRRAQAVSHLQHELLLTEKAARWAVDCWAAAIGIDQFMGTPSAAGETGGTQAPFARHSPSPGPSASPRGHAGSAAPAAPPPPAAQAASPYHPVAPAPGSGWRWLLFSFHGRATRSDYWLRFFLPYFLLSIAVLFLDLAAGTFDPDSGTGIFSFLFSLVALWPSLAVAVKRFHDRNRSGWYLLVALLPIIGWIWMFIELCCLRGTPGDNRFGADPLAGKA